MTLPLDKLQQLSRLAYIEDNPQDMEALANEVGSILDFAQQLQDIDTKGIAPLFHPMDLHQRFREDEATEENCLVQLAEIAPHFEESFYLVPQIMESGK